MNTCWISPDLMIPLSMVFLDSLWVCIIPDYLNEWFIPSLQSTNRLLWHRFPGRRDYSCGAATPLERRFLSVWSDSSHSCWNSGWSWTECWTPPTCIELPHSGAPETENQGTKVCHMSLHSKFEIAKLFINKRSKELVFYYFLNLSLSVKNGSLCF